MVFVAPSFDWGAGRDPGDLLPFEAYDMSAFIQLDTGAACILAVARGMAPATSGTVAPATPSHADGTVQMDPGVVVKPGVKICLSVNQTSQPRPAHFGGAVLHGYLTKDK
jgi:hypothetical protein